MFIFCTSLTLIKPLRAGTLSALLTAVSLDPRTMPGTEKALNKYFSLEALPNSPRGSGPLLGFLWFLAILYITAHTPVSCLLSPVP